MLRWGDCCEEETVTRSSLHRRFYSERAVHTSDSQFLKRWHAPVKLFKKLKAPQTSRGPDCWVTISDIFLKWVTCFRRLWLCFSSAAQVKQLRTQQTASLTKHTPLLPLRFSPLLFWLITSVDIKVNPPQAAAVLHRIIQTGSVVWNLFTPQLYSALKSGNLKSSTESSGEIQYIYIKMTQTELLPDKYSKQCHLVAEPHIVSTTCYKYWIMNISEYQSRNNNIRK